MQRSLIAASAGAALPWYRAGGAPAPVAVYEPAAAASLAASYVPTIATAGYPSLDPAVVGGVAPTWSAGTGWAGGGGAYLKSGVVVGSGWSAIVKFALSFENTPIIGYRSASAFNIYPRAGGLRYYRNGNTSGLGISGIVDSGIMAIAGDTGYLNGTPEVGTIPGTISGALELYFLALNNSGSVGAQNSGSIAYIAIWDTSTNHATWMPAVSAAMAAL